MDPFLNQVDYFKAKLVERLKEIDKKLNAETIYRLIQNANENYADYAIHLNALAKTSKINPNELAEKIKKSFYRDETFKVNIVNGYLNFTIKTNALAKYTLNSIIVEKNNYGKINIGAGKTVVIDFSSPNIAKPFGIGHLRSTVIGDALKRIYSYLGFKVVGINYFGDYGTQFGKLIYAYKHLAGKDKEKRLKDDGVKYLFELYVKFHELAEKKPELESLGALEFKKLEEGDEENLRLWKKFKEISIKEFERIYRMLNVNFDAYEFESESAKSVNDVVKKLEQNKLLKISEGAKVVDLKKYNLGVAIILKKDNTSIYLSRDLAAIIRRYEKYKFDIALYVTGSEQKLHFKQLFKIAELLGYKFKAYHVNFGLYRLKTGKMSTRKGKVILMEDVINEVIKLAEKNIREKGIVKRNIKEYARKIAIAAIKFNDLSQDRVKDIVFDWNAMLKLEGDTSVYVNYALVRATSILNKVSELIKTGGKSLEFKPLKQYHFKDDIKNIERKLIKHLYKLPQIIVMSLNQNKPHFIARYLLALAKLFNEFYMKVKVKNAKKIEEKVNLVKSIEYVFKIGFELLGMP